MKKSFTAAKRGERRERINGNPDKIEGILSAALKRYGLDRQVARYRFIHHWEEIVGTDIAKRTKPECLRGGRLVVRVCSSAWAQELTFQAPVILNRLKKFTNADEVVNDVLFYVGEV